jgi:hypothetical protein
MISAGAVGVADARQWSRRLVNLMRIRITFSPFLIRIRIIQAIFCHLIVCNHHRYHIVAGNSVPP